MALRGTLTHRKIRRLAQRLKISQCFALGICEAMWHVTAEQAPDGSIGRMCNRDIADEIFYDGDPDEMIAALVSAGLLDEDKIHRLIVHDWHIYSDDSTDNKVTRMRITYANGAAPRMTRLSKEEREKFTAEASANMARRGHDMPRHAHAVRTESHEKPLPEPVPVPVPEPVPEPEPLVFGKDRCLEKEKEEVFGMVGTGNTRARVAKPVLTADAVASLSKKPKSNRNSKIVAEPP